MTLTSAAVPIFGNEIRVMGTTFILSIATLTNFFSSSGSFTSVFLEPPFTTIAFSFFDPITAPTPPLPKARSASFIMEEILTKFSPAGPIDSMCMLSPSISFNFSSVLSVSRPQIFDASLMIVPFSPFINMYPGVLRLPSIKMPSNPHLFITGAKKPPELE